MTLKERMAAIGEYEANDETKAFAQYCLQKCVEWFGAPPDIARPYRFETDLYSYCLYHFLEKTYIIAFAPADRFEVSKDRHWWVLAHEMYHRCTMRRGRMRKYVWVDEMLACATAFQICRTIPEWTQKNQASSVSFSQYLAQTHVSALPESMPTEEILQSYLIYKPVADRVCWMQMKRWHIAVQKAQMLWFWKKRRQASTRLYPAGFSDWVVQLGEALRYTITWEELCRLAFAKNLNAWLDTLPAMKREFTEILLQYKQPDPARLASYPAHSLLSFGYALVMMHEYETAFALYLELEKKHRIPSERYKHFADILTKRGVYDQAAYCEQKAFAFGLQDNQARIDLAYALIAAGQYHEALPYVDYVLAQPECEMTQYAKEYYEIVYRALSAPKE